MAERTKEQQRADVLREEAAELRAEAEKLDLEMDEVHGVYVAASAEYKKKANTIRGKIDGLVTDARKKARQAEALDPHPNAVNVSVGG